MKALLVEDSELIRADLVDLLNKYENISLIQASNGQDAIKAFDSENPDIIILDLGLPYLSGVEVLKKIKTIKPSIRVIILTNHREKYFLEICQKYGANYFFDKSAQLDDFLKTMKTLLQQE